MAYQRYKLAKTGSMVSDIWLFTEFKENWQYFFNESTMTPDAPGDVDKVLNVKSFSRRRGPGAPAKAVAAHSRYFARSAKTKGSARPGNPYIIAELDAIGGGYRERRQFALLGDDMDIIAYAKAKAKFQLHVTNHRGWTSIIPGAGAGTLVVPTAAPVNP